MAFKEHSLSAQNEEEMLALGAGLATACSGGLTIYLMGNLGMGKTTLCRGFLQHYGHKGAVKSPTYTLVEPYSFSERDVFHFDLYRLGDPSELEYIGIRDYFNERDICLIEWPQQGQGFLPPADLTVRIDTCKEKGHESGRQLLFEAGSSTGERVITTLLSKCELETE